jgi:Bacteriophage lambda head decoration protein D
MSAILKEPRRPGEYLLSEAEGARSRDAIEIVAGAGRVQPSTVLGRVGVVGKKYRPHDPAATDGSEVPAAVLMYSVDATTENVIVTAHTRDCEVKSAELVLHPSVTPAERDALFAALAAHGIIVR